MKMFNEIKIKNFSKFYGTHCFKLDNKTLFTGRNGAGKTTMIRILKFALYGKLLFENKRDKQNFFRGIPSRDYKDYINKELNRRAKGENDYSISLSIDINLKIKGNIERYIIKRYWNLEYNFDETFEIYKVEDNKKELLSPVRALEVQKYIRIAYPPSYFDFFLLDGEETDPLLSDNFSNNFREVTLSLFNLDLIDKLIDDVKDIKTLENQLKLFQRMDMLQYRFNELKDKITKKKTKLDDIEDEEKENKIKEEIKSLNKKRNAVNRKLKKEYKNNQFPILKDKIEKSLDGYFQKQFDKYMNLLEQRLNQLIPKFVVQIKKTNIDFKNFFLQFYSYQDFKLPIKNFSTAEGQILKYALLVTLLDISKKVFPLIADNMQTRLDRKNRNKILDKIQELKQQIIMLDLEHNLKLKTDYHYHLESKAKNKVS